MNKKLLFIFFLLSVLVVIAGCTEGKFSFAGKAIGSGTSPSCTAGRNGSFACRGIPGNISSYALYITPECRVIYQSSEPCPTGCDNSTGRCITPPASTCTTGFNSTFTCSGPRNTSSYRWYQNGTPRNTSYCYIIPVLNETCSSGCNTTTGRCLTTTRTCAASLMSNYSCVGDVRYQYYRNVDCTLTRTNPYTCRYGCNVSVNYACCTPLLARSTCSSDNRQILAPTNGCGTRVYQTCATGRSCRMVTSNNRTTARCV